MNELEYPEIMPEEALQAVGTETLFIDLREDFEFEDKCMDVKNVFNFPFSNIEKNLSKIPKDKRLILVCATGIQSNRAAELLQKNRFKNFSILTGGIIHWAMEGLPMKSKPNELPDDIFEPHKCNKKTPDPDIID